MVVGAVVRRRLRRRRDGSGTTGRVLSFSERADQHDDASSVVAPVLVWWCQGRTTSPTAVAKLRLPLLVQGEVEGPVMIAAVVPVAPGRRPPGTKRKGSLAPLGGVVEGVVVVLLLLAMPRSMIIACSLICCWLILAEMKKALTVKFSVYSKLQLIGNLGISTLRVGMRE